MLANLPPPLTFPQIISTHVYICTRTRQRTRATQGLRKVQYNMQQRHTHTRTSSTHSLAVGKGKRNPNSAHKLPLPREQQQQHNVAA